MWNEVSNQSLFDDNTTGATCFVLALPPVLLLKVAVGHLHVFVCQWVHLGQPTGQTMLLGNVSEKDEDE